MSLSVLQLALYRGVGGLPLLAIPDAPLSILSYPLPYLNSKTLHFNENLMKIGPKLKHQYLTITSLGANSADDKQIDVIFLIFSENRI